MQVSKAGLALLKTFEGYRSSAYNIGDYWTIGYGSTRYENGSRVKAGDKITKERAEQLYTNIVNTEAGYVSKALKVSVSQKLFDACVSYSYNRGIGKFIKSLPLKFINAGATTDKIGAAFVSDWGTNQRYKNELIERRKKEVAYFSSDSFSTFGNLAGVNIGAVVLLSFLSINYLK